MQWTVTEDFLKTGWNVLKENVYEMVHVQTLSIWYESSLEQTRIMLKRLRFWESISSWFKMYHLSTLQLKRFKGINPDDLKMGTFLKTETS